MQFIHHNLLLPITHPSEEVTDTESKDSDNDNSPPRPVTRSQTNARTMVGAVKYIQDAVAQSAQYMPGWWKS